jgi:hypothetical protein
MTEQERPRFPGVMHHKHGLYEWEPMMPERSAETITPGEPPKERIYRCQRLGCDAVVRIDAEEVRPRPG